MKDKGFIVVLVAFTLVILFTFGTFLLEISKTDFDMGNTQVARTQAYYNAESALNQALAQLSADEAKLIQLKNTINGLAPGGKADIILSVPEIDENGNITWPNPEKLITFTVSKEMSEIENITNDITLTTKTIGTYSGKYGEALKKLNVQSKIVMENGWLLPENAAIVSEGLIDLKNGSSVTGDLYAGSFSLKGSLIGNANKSDSIVFPQLDEAQFSDWDNLPNEFIAGRNLAELSPGNYYSTTPVDFYGDYTGHIVLVFDCNLVLFNNSNGYPVQAADGDFINNSLIVICLGSVEFKNGREFEGIIVAPNEPVVFKNGGTFTGTIISNVSFEGKNGVSITYNNEIANNFNDFIINTLDDGNFDFDIRYWK